MEAIVYVLQKSLIVVVVFFAWLKGRDIRNWIDQIGKLCEYMWKSA